MIRQNKLSGVRCSLIFSALFLPFFAMGQSTYYTEVKKPIVRYEAVGLGLFDTPQAAFDAYKADYISSHLGWSIILTGLRPCSSLELNSATGATWGQYGYIWGEPFDWCHNYDITDPAGQKTGSGVTSSVHARYDCPDPQGWGTNGYQTVLSIASGTGRAGDPYYLEPRCERSVEVKHPEPSCATRRGNPVDFKDASKYQQEVDYVDASGLLSFVRSYDSKAAAFYGNIAFDFMPPIKGFTTYREPMYVSYSNGNGVYARLLSYAERINPYDTTAVFTNASGVRYEFSWDKVKATPIHKYNKDRLIKVDFPLGLFNWQLSKVDESRIYTYSSDGLLVSISDINGRKIKFAYSLAAAPNFAPGPNYVTFIEDDFARRVDFRYDDKGLLLSLIDPAGGVISYVHESSDPGLANTQSSTIKPVKVTYQDGGIKKYLWDESAYLSWDAYTKTRANLLTGIQDENGDRYATFVYKNGKAVSTEHAGGVDRFTIQDKRPVVGEGVGVVSVIDPIKTARDTTFDWIGGYSRITKNSQPAGSGCAASSSTLSYDLDGNIISEVDFNGNRVCRDVDVVRGLETAHIDGYLSADTCPASVQNAVMPADITKRKTTKQWHPDWNLETRRSEPLKITTWVYNGQPDPTAGNTVASCAPATALLPDGKPIVVLCKQVEQATTDINGKLGLSAVGGVSRTWSYTYNQYGQVLNATDPRGGTTVYVYAPITTGDYTAGDLESVTNPAGHTTQYTRYDAHGRPLQIIAPDGLTTDLSYYPRGWLKATTVTPAGAATGRTTNYTYDLVGQLKTVSFPDATTLSYKYDAAHRLYNIQDNLGNSVTYTLDDAGHRTREAFTDPTGALVKNMTRVYDALGRAQSVTGAR